MKSYIYKHVITLYNIYVLLIYYFDIHTLVTCDVKKDKNMLDM